MIKLVPMISAEVIGGEVNKVKGIELEMDTKEDMF